MTTIIGLHSVSSNEVVLISDLQATYIDHRKSPFNKLMISDDRKVVFGTSGIIDDYTQALWKDMVGGKIDLHKIIERGIFPGLRDSNLKRWDGRNPDLSNSCSMLLATNFDKPQLYTCWPLGRVEPRTFTYIGSGSSDVEAYINSKMTTYYAESGSHLVLENLPSSQLTKIGYTALKLATKHDLYSGGLNAAIVKQKSIKSLSKKLAKASRDSSRGELSILLG